MTPIKAPRYFDFNQIAHVHQMTLPEIEGVCRPFNARLGTLGDAVCFGKILAHIAQSGRHRERDLDLNEWVRSVSPEGCQLSARQIGRYRQISPLDPAEVTSYSMSLEALAAVTAGPLGPEDAPQKVRRCLLSLGEQATTEEQIAKLKQAAEVGVALLLLGTPLERILERCEKIALGQVQLPGKSTRGRPKETKPQIALKTAKSLRGQLLKIAENAELAVEILDVVRESYQLARFRAGLDSELPEETADAASAGAGGAGTAHQDDRRRYQRTAEPAKSAGSALHFDTKVNDNDSLQGLHGNNSAAAEEPQKAASAVVAADDAAGDQPVDADEDEHRDEEEDEPQDHDEEEEGPDDYYLPMVQAVMAALDPLAQAELGEVLVHVVAGDEVEEFDWTVNNLWEHCGLEAAGVDKQDFDFFMGHLCGPDRVLRGRHALAFLRAAEPPDLELHLRGLQTIELPAELKAEVAALCQRVPPVEVPGEGEEEAELERELEILLHLSERIMAQLPQVAPHGQRELLMEGYQLWRRLRAQGFLGTNPEPTRAKTMSFGSLIWKV